MMMNYKFLGYIISIILLNTFGVGFGQKPSYDLRISQIYQNITQKFYIPSKDLYLETTDTVHNEKPVSYLWPLCALVQAANEMEVVNPSQSYLEPVLKTIEHYYNPYPPTPGYQAYIAQAGKDTRYIDDNQWIGIACMDAYHRTHKPEYLQKSKLIYNFMMTGFDTVTGGGLYWRENDKSSKNTCSNGPGILLALQIYLATGEKEYLDCGLSLYQWVNKHLLSSKGIYYDAIRTKDNSIDSAFYTYNTGTMLQANVLLYRITKKKEYLDNAIQMAESAQNYFYKNNKLPDHYWFNAVLLRGYLELYKIEGKKGRLQFFVDDANRIWENEKDKSGMIGRHPSKSLIDQAAMLEVYCRLKYLK